MLTPAQRDRVEIVLVSPRNPLNIGAAARAMANFGFSRLSVAAPYAPHWREAKSAVGAPEILSHAGEFPALAEALAGCTFVAGTGTLTHRKPEQPVVPLHALAPLLLRELDRGDPAGRIALVFGPEKHGLTRDDLSFCHVLVEIPTDPRQPSMNLGQAVAVCLYELARPIPAGEPASRAHPAAASAQLDRLADLIEQTMVAARYSPAAMQESNRHDLRLLLRRLNLSPADLRRVLGLFRRILWRLGNPPSGRA
ncbi:MAG TPA: RNA methyltransferase [Terracidiphilus sp.]|nr:RNA methyltransferase [Terracidiphilus sp.]